MISDLINFFAVGSLGVDTGSAVVDGGTNFFSTVLAAARDFISGFGS